MDEFQRIARLRAELAGSDASASGSGVLLGIGDDAAVLARPAGNLVLSVDAAVEGVHFRAGFADWATLGARALAAALSDLAAMGAQPRAALSALVLPPDFGDDQLAELARGQAQAATRHCCPVVGGNLARGSELSITTTVLGEVAGVGLTRAGARPGDAIYVTGVLGAAALGLALLEPGAGASEGAELRDDAACAAFVARWRAPVPRLVAGLQLVSCASAAIDVSDGLLQDLGHLCEASGVGAVLLADALPQLSGFAALARALGRDPLALMLTGGEDYELVYTLPASEPAGRAEPWAAARRAGTRIGEITGRDGVIELRDARGAALALPGPGYRHFGG